MLDTAQAPADPAAPPSPAPEAAPPAPAPEPAPAAPDGPPPEPSGELPFEDIGVDQFGKVFEDEAKTKTPGQPEQPTPAPAPDPQKFTLRVDGEDFEFEDERQYRLWVKQDARVRGLQSAHDREVNELKRKLNDYEAQTQKTQTASQIERLQAEARTLREKYDSGDDDAGDAWQEKLIEIAQAKMQMGQGQGQPDHPATPPVEFQVPADGYESQLSNFLGEANALAMNPQFTGLDPREIARQIAFIEDAAVNHLRVDQAGNPYTVDRLRGELRKEVYTEVLNRLGRQGVSTGAPAPPPQHPQHQNQPSTGGPSPNGAPAASGFHPNTRQNTQAPASPAAPGASAPQSMSKEDAVRAALNRVFVR